MLKSTFLTGVFCTFIGLNFHSTSHSKVNTVTPQVTYSASIKVLLEGFTDSTTGLMHTDLNTQNLIPNAQPFNEEPWNYSGTETLVNIPADMTDWTLIILRDNSGNILEQKAGYVDISGQIYDINGDANITFTNMSDNYISVHSRNHLAVLISVPITGQMTYDLTTDLSLVSGAEQMKLVGDRYTLYAGDYCANALFNNLDYNIWTSESAAALQYKTQDGDGNGVVNNLDYNLWTNNASKVGEQLIQYTGADCTLNTTSTPLVSAFDEFNPDAVTVSFDGDEVTIESNGLPNHTSPYWPEGEPLYIDPVVAVAQTPGSISEGSYTLTVSTTPEIAPTSTATGLGAIGISVSGVPIYNDTEGPNRPLEEQMTETFDYAGGHNGPTGYHYHIEALDVPENTMLSHDDEKLVGIMSDGFFLYGRKDVDGTYPSDLDESGGHWGLTPHSNGEEIYHYHIINEHYFENVFVLFGGDLQGTPNQIF